LLLFITIIKNQAIDNRKKRMFVQVLIEEKKKEEERMLISWDLYIYRLFSFFLSCTYDRCKIVKGNEEKSCWRPIVPSYLANERCQRTTERERDKYQKMTEKQQQQHSNLSLVDRKKMYNIQETDKHALNGFYH
jgi:hypothetical protein